MSLEDSIIARAPVGVSEHDAPGPWRVIVARTANASRAWYHGRNDDPRYVDVLRRAAGEWFAARSTLADGGGS